MFSLAVLLVLFYYIRSFFEQRLLTRGGGVRPVLYNFRGSEVLLYNVIWGRGVVKKSTFFVLYNMWTTPNNRLCRRLGVIFRPYVWKSTVPNGYFPSTMLTLTQTLKPKQPTMPP